MCFDRECGKDVNCRDCGDAKRLRARKMALLAAQVKTQSQLAGRPISNEDLVVLEKALIGK